MMPVNPPPATLYASLEKETRDVINDKIRIHDKIYRELKDVLKQLPAGDVTQRKPLVENVKSMVKNNESQNLQNFINEKKYQLILDRAWGIMLYCLAFAAGLCLLGYSAIAFVCTTLSACMVKFWRDGQRFLAFVVFTGLSVFVGGVYNYGLKLILDALGHVFGYILSAVTPLFKGLLSLLGWVFGKVSGFFKSLFTGPVLPSWITECGAGLCAITQLVDRLGGIEKVGKLVTLGVMLLLSMNDTHDFVDAEGNKHAILSKDFDHLPTLVDQRYRISRKQASAPPKMDIPIVEKGSFQEKARVLHEEHKKKPVEAEGRDWATTAAFWCLNLMSEVAVTFATQMGASLAWKHVFGGNPGRVMQALATTGAGAGGLFIMREENTGLMATVGIVFSCVAYKLVGEVVGLFFGSAGTWGKSGAAPVAGGNPVGAAPAGSNPTATGAAGAAAMKRHVGQTPSTTTLAA